MGLGHSLGLGLVCFYGRWRLTCVLDVEVCGLGPGSVPSQRGGPDPYCVVPRMHHFQLTAMGHFVHVPRHTVVQLLQKKQHSGSGRQTRNSIA